MIIQWFPGHMHKARKEMKQLLPQVDIVIEILDSRIPFSSQNPLLQEIATHKPVILVMNKMDLADETTLIMWKNYLEKNKNIKTLAVSSQQTDRVKSILDLCREMNPDKGDHQIITAMIMGIPNVGKSTIINILADRIVAKTGNEPAVTKGQQRIKISKDIVFYDTPGMLWPRIRHQDWALRLAITGAIKETAINYEDLAYYFTAYLRKYRPEVLLDRFQLEYLPDDEYAILEQIGSQRGCLKSGKILDLQKVSSILINEYRSGKLGSFCLESPAEVELEKQQADELDIQREEKKAARKAKRKKR